MMQPKNSKKHSKVIAVLAVLSIVVGALYCVREVRDYSGFGRRPGMPPGGAPPGPPPVAGASTPGADTVLPPETGPGPGTGPPPPGGPGGMRWEEQLNLSPEQKTVLDDVRAQGIPQTPEERRERAARIKEALSPQQLGLIRQRMNEGMQRMVGRKMNQAARVLPPDQYKAFEAKMKVRVQEMQRRIEAGEMPPPPPPR